ncbi:MAG: 16S rRNA (adenine(1518)-N(6)/adenine(1519)-N(6))-dimethyltransferase RsmA [Candidatus Peribacteraceae bacterium]|nr:16S rRNA (adenine(1518)-N(6)/adenine(1519)-N(6))-dimethyltransferase RsmA [Candidatus Peribacteraceae bacterium]
MLADDVRDFLHRHKVWLTKDLGQHFLTDDAVLGEILQAAKVKPGDNVLEIGPGIGILTRELLRAGANVTAVELDERMLPLLKEFIGQELTADRCSLIAVQGNALHTPISIPPPYSVVANIPYAITSPLLRRLLLELPDLPTSLTLLIQREVAETICAKTTEGILTALVGLCGKPTLIRHVPSVAFLPPPAVESSVLHIECFKEPLADRDTIKRILKLVKHAMSGRRKMLRNTVGSLPDGMKALEETGIDPERRPQTMHVEEWMKLERNIDRDAR